MKGHEVRYEDKEGDS